MPAGGQIKTTVLLAFTLSAYNIVRSFKAKHGVDDNDELIAKPQQKRARRRTGTWTEVVEPTSGAPPPTSNEARSEHEAGPR
jgi:hypothetical protein